MSTLEIKISKPMGQQHFNIVSIVDQANKVIDHFRVPAGLAQVDRLVNHDMYGMRIKAANRKVGATI